MTCYQKVTNTTIHVKDIQKLMKKSKKISHNEKVFTKGFLKYDLRNYSVTLLPNTKTKNYGTDTIAYRAAQFCIKFAIVKFIQIRNKKLTLYDCPYNICRIFVGSEGFII